MDRSLCNAVVLLFALFGSLHSCKNEASPLLVMFEELSEVVLRSVEAIEEDRGKESSTSNLFIDQFHTVQHLTQYRDGEDVIVADYGHHCIKIINRATRVVRRFAGRCHDDSHVEQRAQALEAKLPHPVGVLYVKEKNLFYYLLEDPKATIVEHDLDTGYVSMKFQDQERFRYPSSMVIDSNNMYLYVTHYLGGISRFDTETWEREIVAGIVTPVDDVVPPSRDGKLLEARFYYRQTGMAWLIQDQVLIVGQRDDHSLRVVNFVDDKVYTMCKGVGSGSQPNFTLGELEICKMNNPGGLVVVNGSVYMGEHSGILSTKRGHILKLPYAQPFCEVAPHPDVTALPLQEVYTHNQVVEYECDREPRLAISANYTTTRCIRGCENETLIGRWDRDPPTQCQTPILSTLEPQQGQIAGGTMVTLTGTFPPNVHVSLKEKNKNVWTSAPLTLKTNKQLAFRMPPQNPNGSSDVKILVAFGGDDTKIGIRNYTYLPNPVIRSVSRNESIASGGLTIKFYGDQITSGHKYEFVVYQETLNDTLATTDCQKEETFVSCPAPNLTEVFETRVRRSADDGVEKITLYMSLLSDNWPVPGTNLAYDVVNSYPKIDPFTDIIPFYLEKGSQLMFNGTNLDTSFTLEDYRVTLVLEQQVNLTCKVTALNQTKMFCKPPAQEILSMLRPNEDVIQVEVKVEVGSLSETVGRVEFIDSVEPTTTRPDKSEAEPKPKANPGLGVSEKILSKLRGMYIDPLDLCFDLKTNPIGKGNFGKVYLGQLRLKQSVLKTVAVKTLKETEDVNVDQLEEFLQEVTFLKYLKHPNILSTIGIVWRDGDRPQAVLPYMALGDLCSLIQKPTMVFTNGDLLHFGMQVASGMDYLTKSRCLHRDLAARNCLVDEKFFVKIADFGMSKDIYVDNYYREGDKSKPKPVRWMALESLRDRVYNAQTEVWSFGVLMWELFTRGSLPYPGISNSEMTHHIVMGYRLYRPSYVHPEIFQRVEKCWSENPADRPTFTELKEFFEFCIVQGRQQQDNQKPYYEEEEEFCYSYVQSLTMHIKNDYTSSTAYDDIYMGVTYIEDAYIYDESKVPEDVLTIEPLGDGRID